MSGAEFHPVVDEVSEGAALLEAVQNDEKEITDTLGLQWSGWTNAGAAVGSGPILEIDAEYPGGVNDNGTAANAASTTLPADDWKANTGGLQGHVTFYRQGRLYVFGGLDHRLAYIIANSSAVTQSDFHHMLGSAPFRTIQISKAKSNAYDALLFECASHDQAHQWSEVKNQGAEVPTQVHGHIGYYIEHLDSFIFTGGSRLWHSQAERWEYSFKTYQWSRIPALGYDRFCPAAGYDPATQRVFLFGGLDSVSDGKVTNSFYAFDVNDHYDLQELPLVGDAPPKLMKAASTVVDGTFFVFGGYCFTEDGFGDILLDGLYCCSTTERVWSKVDCRPPPPQLMVNPFARSRPNCVALPTLHSFLICNGYGQGGLRMNDTILYHVPSKQWVLLDRGTKEGCTEQQVKAFKRAEDKQRGESKEVSPEEELANQRLESVMDAAGRREASAVLPHLASSTVVSLFPDYPQTVIVCGGAEGPTLGGVPQPHLFQSSFGPPTLKQEVAYLVCQYMQGKIGG